MMRSLAIHILFTAFCYNKCSRLSCGAKSIPQATANVKSEQTMSDPYRPSRYRVYLLRFWEEGRENPELPGTWRFSLEDPRTSQRRGFADLEAMVGFVRQEMRRGTEGDRG
jgi:hypothetical protein